MLRVCVLHLLCFLHFPTQRSLNAVAVMVRMSIKNKKQTSNSTNKKLIYLDILNSVNACLGNWASETGWSMVTVPEGDTSLCCKSPCNDIQLGWIGAAETMDLLRSYMQLGRGPTWPPQHMHDSFLLIDFNYVQDVFIISICKTVMWNFYICTNSFYWIFTRFLFMYNFHQFYSRNGLWQSLAAFSTQEINQHIRHTNGACWLRCSRSCLGSFWDCLNLTLLPLSPLSQTSLALYAKWGAAKSSGELTTKSTGCMYRHNPDTLLDHSCSLNSVGFVTRLTSKRRMTSSV